MKNNELIEVAKIGRAVGLKGFMKLHDLSDFPEQFKKGARFFIEEDESLEIAEFDKNKGVARFVGISDRDAAVKLTNKILKTTKEQTRQSCALKEGEFFWFDIIGCTIIEEGRTLGRVSAIERIGAQDFLSVHTSDELYKEGFQKHFLVPYIDKFIKNTDISAATIETSGALLLAEK